MNDNVFYTLLVIMIILSVCAIGLFITTIWSFNVAEKESKVFIDNLKVGDEARQGTVTKINDEYVELTISYPKKYLKPKKYKCNSPFFIFK